MKLLSLYVKAFWRTLANTQLIFLKKSICMLLKIVLSMALHYLTLDMCCKQLYLLLQVASLDYNPKHHCLGPVCIISNHPICWIGLFSIAFLVTQTCSPSLFSTPLVPLSILLLSFSLFLAEFYPGNLELFAFSGSNKLPSFVTY